MRRSSFAAVVVAVALSTASAFAADLARLPPIVPPPPPSPWDVAFGGALMSDYVFRGVTQSAHKPSVAAYFEPRYNFNPNLQLYAGIGGESIDFPNHAAAEIDLYGGVRPTFGPVALDFGVWYYYYPGGRLFNALTGPASCTNGFFSPPVGFITPVPALSQCNVSKSNDSFVELYAKATWTINDQWALGGNFYYSPNFLNLGATGEYASVTLKWTAPATLMPWGMGAYVSGELGRQWLGTSDPFYGVVSPLGNFALGVPYADYTTWNVGIGFTKSVFTLDLRYYDTDLSKAACNTFTSDHTAAFSLAAITPTNPSGLASNFCDSRFVAKGSFDLTALTNLK